VTGAIPAAGSSKVSASNVRQPGGNVTGVSFLANSLLPKQFEVLHETIPKAASIGFLVNPINPNAEADAKDVQAAADTLGRKLFVVQARTDSDFEAAFATLIPYRHG
jgi:putative ABC transport system substrate-binding protein